VCGHHLWAQLFHDPQPQVVLAWEAGRHPIRRDSGEASQGAQLGSMARPVDMRFEHSRIPELRCKACRPLLDLDREHTEATLEGHCIPRQAAVGKERRRSAPAGLRWLPSGFWKRSWCSRSCMATSCLDVRSAGRSEGSHRISSAIFSAAAGQAGARVSVTKVAAGGTIYD
jgi:hypothetical protein